MALTLTQKPTTPNASRTNLLYTLTSDSSSKDQFRYIVDVETSEIPTSHRDVPYPKVRLKYYPNTTGSGIIDLAPVFNRYLAFDQESMSWEEDVNDKTFSLANSTIQLFTCSFGEEFADSPSSSLQVYTGSIVNHITVFPGKVDIESGDYNFNTSSAATGSNNILSNMPECLYSQSQYDFINECPKMGWNDYNTVTIMKGVDQLYSINFYTEGADLYTGSRVTGAGVSSDAVQDLVVIPNGVRNFIQDNPANATVTGSAAWMTFEQTGSVGQPNNHKTISYMLPNHSRYPCDKMTIDSQDASFGRKKTISQAYIRFVWQNNYGFWDFYNVYNTLRQVDTVERETYTKPFPIYDQTTSPFNINNRGEKQVSSILTEQFTITTDYVSKKTSDWLTELFDSNNVYIYINSPDYYLERKYGTGKRAIIINNVNYRWQENKFRNKTFQYDINWQFSNKTFVY